jgi:putative acetyltransferase
VPDIAPVDPRTPEVAALIGRHLAFANAHTPKVDVHALDASGLLDGAVMLLGCRDGETLVAVGALRHLEPGHVEIKSMHVAEEMRGRGIGRAVLDHLLDEARRRGISRVSLETGSMPAFAAARAMYERAGFSPCPPFGEYREGPNSVCYTLAL